MMDSQQLAEIEARLAATTPKPWKHYHYGNTIEVQKMGECPIVGWPGFDDCDRPVAKHRANAKWMVAAHDTDMPALIAEVKRLTALLAEETKKRMPLGNSGAWKLVNDLEAENRRLTAENAANAEAVEGWALLLEVVPVTYHLNYSAEQHKWFNWGWAMFDRPIEALRDAAKDVRAVRCD